MTIITALKSHAGFLRLSPSPMARCIALKYLAQACFHGHTSPLTESPASWIGSASAFSVEGSGCPNPASNLAICLAACNETSHIGPTINPKPQELLFSSSETTSPKVDRQLVARGFKAPNSRSGIYQRTSRYLAVPLVEILLLSFIVATVDRVQGVLKV